MNYDLQITCFRRIIFHGQYISLDLAWEMLKRKTHVVGRIRKNSRGIPKELAKKKVEVEQVREMVYNNKANFMYSFADKRLSKSRRSFSC